MIKKVGLSFKAAVGVYILMALACMLVVPRVIDKPESSRCHKAVVDLNILKSALNLFHMDFKNYPSTEEGLEILLVPNKINNGYMKILPKDPWGEGYIYNYPPKNKEKTPYELYSKGENKLDDMGLKDDISSFDYSICGTSTNNHPVTNCLFYTIFYVALPVFILVLCVLYLIEKMKTKYNNAN